MFRNATRRAALAVAVVAFVLGSLTLVIVAAFPKGAAPISDPIDFLAFYSASKAAASGRDPYLAEPLRSYERNALAESNIVIVPNLVVPAPLPPYELAIFSGLSLLSFRFASALWFAIALAALGATIVLLRRSTGASLLAIVPAVFLMDGYASVSIGQIVPLVVCALAAAGYALECNRPRLAAVLVLGTALEPHIGLAAMLGLFVWEPRARRALLAGLAVLALLSLSSGGLARNVEYLTLVLPAQARGEGLEFGGQYSLSAVLAAYGTAAAAALAIGSAWYAAMLVVAASFAGNVARAFGRRSALVVFPTALAVLGGTYVHIHQIAFALPLLCLVLASKGRIAKAGLFAFVLLALPWESFFEEGFGQRPAVVRPADVAQQLARVSSPVLPAEVAWGVWVRSGARDSRTREERLACKLPTWLGLLALMALTAACVARTRRRPVAPSKDDVRENGSSKNGEFNTPLGGRVRRVPSS